MKYTLLILVSLCLILGPALAQSEAPAWLDGSDLIEEEIPAKTAPEYEYYYEEPAAEPVVEPAPAIEPAVEEEYVPAEEAEEVVEEAAAEEPTTKEAEEEQVTKAIETATWLGMGLAGGCLTVDSEWSRDLNEKMRLALGAGWGLGDFYTVTKLSAGVNQIITEMPLEYMSGILELYGGAKISYANYSIDVQDLILVGTGKSGGTYGLNATLGARYDTMRVEAGLDTALGLIFVFENRFILH